MSFLRSFGLKRFPVGFILFDALEAPLVSADESALSVSLKRCNFIPLSVMNRLNERLEVIGRKVAGAHAQKIFGLCCLV